jgi:hypothetical protein
MKTNPLAKHGGIISSSSSRQTAPNSLLVCKKIISLSSSEPAKMNVGVFSTKIDDDVGRNVQPASLPSSPQRAVSIIVLSA